MNTAIEFPGIVERLVRHVQDGTTDRADDVYEIDVEQYFAEDRYRIELDRIFRRTPLLLALSSDLPLPGSFKTFDIADVPVLLVRGSDAVLRAFINVCRHRGARLVEEEYGCKRRFTCPFHAWTFDNQGTLTGVPGARDFGEFDRSIRGLTALPCEERDGLVWAVLTPELPLDVSDHLGGLGGELAGFKLANARHVATRFLETGNWKIAMDTYLENYHVGFLHQKTFGRTAISDSAVIDWYGRHQRMIVPRKSLRAFESAREISDPYAVMSLNYNIFPNSILLVTPEMAMLSRVVPGRDVGHSVTVQEFFAFGEFESDEKKAAFEARVEMTHLAVSSEDYRITDGTQRGLRSGGNKTFMFGRNEPALQRFHRQIDEVCASS